MKLFLAFSLAILIPLIPFLLLGETFENRLEALLHTDMSFWTRFVLVSGMLAIDIFLPVPSSAVNTYAGATMGIPWATLASFIGMTVGGLIGFALARFFGEPLLRSLTSQNERDWINRTNQSYGVWSIIITRGLPLLAEPCVFLLGASQMSWRRFLPPFLLANLAISFIYATFGSVFGTGEYLLIALIMSMVLPLLVTYLLRRRHRIMAPSSIHSHR